MKNLRQLLHRSGLLPSEQGNRRSRKARRSKARHRRLTNELLEQRQLLAGDVGGGPETNGRNPWDVNGDRQITARDALGVINFLAAPAEAESVGTKERPMFYDVNGDEKVSAADALGVINALGRGEEVGEVIELMLTARDLNDQPITPDGNGHINVEVGEFFDLEVSYEDLRTFNNNRGAFQIYADIGVSTAGVLSPVLNETQQLVFDSSITTVSSTAVRFTIPEAPPGVTNGSLSYDSPINDFANNIEGEISNALAAFGYSYDPMDSSVNDFTVRALDVAGDDLAFEIHWVGDQFGNVDLPDITIDVLESNPSDDVPTRTIEHGPFLADGVTPNPEAVPFNINTRSRTFNDNESLYSLFPRGSFDLASGFSDVGGLVKNIGGTRIQDLTDDGSFIEPFDAWSLRVFVNQPVSGLVVDVNPGEDEEAVLMFGLEDPLIADDYLIETVDSTTNGTAIVTINAGAVGTPGDFTVSPETTSVNEDGNTVTVTVNRVNGSDGEVSVDFTTVDGTANAGSDYTANAGTLTFADGETSKTIDVTITDDGDDEGDENFSVELSNPTGGSGLLAPTSSTVTIIDNDGAPEPGTLDISPASVSVSESGNTVTLTVNRTNGSDGAISVDFSTSDGTATAGSDYVANSGTLNFADGVTSQTITIAISEDDLDEVDENFTVSISNATGGASLGSTTMSTVTILDNDEPPVPGTFEISPVGPSVNEDANTVTLTVNRTGGSDGAVTVDFTTADGSANAGSDYVATSGTLNFADGVTSQTITVSINDDDLDENNETFTVTISNPTGGADLGNATVSTVSIIDNDEFLPGTLSISPVSASVNEAGSSITLTVSRSGGSDGAVSVDFATADVTATAGADYVATSGTLNFADGQTTQTITVNISDDSDDEPNETFTVTLSNATGGAGLGAAVSTVTIIDDEVNQPPQVTDPVTQSVQDGGSGTVNLLDGTTDPDGDQMTVSNVVLVSGDGSGITVSGNTLLVDGSAYSALVGGASTNAVYTYDISDGVNAPVSQTATITINGVNDPPIARDDNTTMVLDTTARIDVLDNDEAGGGEIQTLTIISASSPNGTATPNNDGTISFTPTSGFLGDTTISYTIEDAQGAQDSATVNVSVRNFDPSSISGALFIDYVENIKDIIAGADPIRNGIKDPREPGFMGVPIRLHSDASDNVSGQEISLAALTGIEGGYSFTDLVPGTYTVTYDVPDTVIYDGLGTYVATIGDAGGEHLTELNFGIHSTRGDALDNASALASSYLRTNATQAQISEGGREGGIVSLDENGNQNFMIALSGFEGVVFAELTLNQARDAALLTVVEEDGDVLVSRLDDLQFVVTPNGRGVQFFGGMNDLDFFDADDSVEQEFTNFRNAVDQVLSSM